MSETPLHFKTITELAALSLNGSKALSPPEVLLPGRNTPGVAL